MATPGAATNGRPTATRTSELVRFATAGSVDDGKSTLIGRLLFDTKSIFEDQLEHVEETSKRRGDGYVNLALLTDGLRAEREQGITIDVAYRYFHTPRRKFIIADTPGHEQYTRNMVTGRLDGGPRAGPGGRAQGRARAVAPARVHRVAPAHPAPGRVRQQDGPGRLGPGGLRPDHRGLHGLGGEARHPGRDLHPGLGAARRQRGRSLREHAVVPGAVAALPPRARARGVRPQPPGRALPGAVGHAPDVGRAARLPRLRGRGGLGRLPQGRRGGRAAVGPHQPDRGHRHLRRRDRGGLPAAVGDAAARGRHRRLARRHDLPAGEPAEGGQGHRRDGLLDVRPPAVAVRPLPHQAHEPHRAGQGRPGASTAST